MKTRLLIILIVVFGFFILIYPAQAFACSLAFDIGFVKPWNEYLHGDCSVTMGTLSWTGMIYIMLVFVIPTVIIKRKKKLQKTFYLIIPVVIFVVMVLYSVFIYGTVDITQFAVPHGIYGGIDYDTVAWLDTEADFARMLEEINVKYSDNYMDTKYDYINGINTDNIEYQINMPANYCGFAIADNGDEFWYTAVFDKTIISSELHEKNPYNCSSDSKECICGIQERIRERFTENEN